MSEKERMPEEWSVKKVTDVSKVENGGTPDTDTDEYWDGDIPWYTPTELTDNSHPTNVEADRHITEKGVNESAAKEFQNGDILLTSRGTVGQTKILLEDSSVNQSCYSLSPEDTLLSYFLHYVLQGRRRKLESIAVGGTFGSITKRELKAFDIPIPETEEQVRIASVLYSVDEQLRVLHDRHDELSRLKHGLIQDLVMGKRNVQDISVNESVTHKSQDHMDSADSRDYKEVRLGPDSVEIPESWDYSTLKELNDEDNPICYGVLKPKEHTDDGYPLVKIGNLESEILNMSQDFHCIPKERHDKYDRSKLSGGEVLISIQGTIGRTCVVPENVDANISRTVAKITPSDKLNPYYLKYYLKHNSVEALMDVVSTGSTRSSFNIEDIRKFPILVPPLWEQERIASILYTVDEMINCTSDLIDEYEQLKRGLMQDLLSGDVRTPEDLEILDKVTNS